MTAVSDLTTVLTILKGSTPTNAQIAKVVALYEAQFPDNATNEQKARAMLDLWRNDIRKRLRAAAESEVYSVALAVAHYPRDQAALIAAAKPAADAAGADAEANL